MNALDPRDPLQKKQFKASITNAIAKTTDVVPISGSMTMRPAPSQIGDVQMTIWFGDDARAEDADNGPIDTDRLAASTP